MELLSCSKLWYVMYKEIIHKLKQAHYLQYRWTNHGIISIFHECMVWIEKSVRRDHCSASLGFHECMVWIEKSVTRDHCSASRICHSGSLFGITRLEKSVTRDHCSASRGSCLVMPNSDPEWQIFLSSPYTHDRYFFLHTFWFTTFDFQRRTCYIVTFFH